ncbi:MAG TPA: glycosyltransferase family 2 protein [Planctomycetota bacterium]|nr:glycosyltransferase family 2 protein [Planctomycetota bacterium]
MVTDGTDMMTHGRSRSAPAVTHDRVAVVIVNYRTAGLAIDCLRSLAPQIERLPGAEVVIVDNASGDQSAERIQSAVDESGWDWARVRRADRNGGFAFGNNVALRELLASSDPPEYILLLNPDTVVRERAVQALAEFLASTPAAGIAGGSLEDAFGTEQRAAHRMPSVWTDLDCAARLGPLTRLLGHRADAIPAPHRPVRCDWVSGACMMVRRDVLARIGLMDERYFLYFEEVDFCARARQAGWEVWCVPQARVVHMEGAATGVRRKSRLGRYWFSSRRRFFVRHHGILKLCLTDVLRGLGRLSLAVRRTLRLGGGKHDDPKRFILDLLCGDAMALLTGELFRVRTEHRVRSGRPVRNERHEDGEPG